MPSVLESTYSPVHARSVAPWRSTRNSSGDRRTCHSSSVRGRAVSLVAMSPTVRRTSGAGEGVTDAVGPCMDDASPTFRPTWQQALGRGLYLGSLVSAIGISVALLVTVAVLAWTEGAAPPVWLWAMLAFGPPLSGVLVGTPACRRTKV